VAHLVGQDVAVEQFHSLGDVGFVGEYFHTDPAQFVKHHAAGHLRRPNEQESEPFRDEYAGLDELAHDERRGHHLERQVEHVQHVCQQPRVVVLFEFEIDPLRREVLIAVAAVGLAEADPESFCLIELCGGQQEQHPPVQAALGPPAAQVAQEGWSVGGMQ
jgi:hypothetical protein